MSTDGTVGGERIALTMRTSWLSEFRTASGVLVMFEILGERLSFGRLCAVLARIPGVEFADFKIPARFAGPARFRFKGQDFHVTMAHLDYRVSALDPIAAYSQSATLLAHVKEQLAQRSSQVAAHRLV
jgi:hypothetical protein